MNVMCFVLSLAAVITWLAQFFLRLRKNVLIREDIANGGWNSEGEATVGYSFWLVFIASIGTAEQESSLDTADFCPLIVQGSPAGFFTGNETNMFECNSVCSVKSCPNLLSKLLHPVCNAAHSKND